MGWTYDKAADQQVSKWPPKQRLLQQIQSNQASRRALWIVGDEALSSLTNFGMTLLVLRHVSTIGFGAFTITYTVYIFALIISRALTGEPQLVRHSHVGRKEWVTVASQTTGAGLLIGIAGSAILLCAVPILYSAGGALIVAGQTLLPLAILLPALLLQDAWRYAFFADGRPSAAFWNDLVWAFLQGGLFIWLIVGRHTSPSLFIVAWAVAAAGAALFGLFQVGFLPKPFQSWKFLVRHRDLGPRFALEALVERGASQLMLFLVAAIAGLAPVGQINAARVAVGPVNFLYMGSIGFGIPEGVRIWRSRPERLARFAGIFGLALAFIALICGSVVYLMPISLGVKIFGHTWPTAHPLLPSVTAWVVGAGLILGARLGLRVHAAARETLAIRTVFGISVVAFCSLGSALGGGQGAATALAVATFMAASLTWWQFHRVNQTALHSRSDDHTALPRSGVG